MLLNYVNVDKLDGGLILAEDILFLFKSYFYLDANALKLSAKLNHNWSQWIVVELGLDSCTYEQISIKVDVCNKYLFIYVCREVSVADYEIPWTTGRRD